MKFTHSEVIFFGTSTIAVPNVTPVQIEAIRWIVAGVQRSELVSLLGSTATAATIAYLDRHHLIRPVYQNEFIDTIWAKQVEFFTDFVDDPHAAQRRLSGASVWIVSCGGAGNIIV